MPCTESMACETVRWVILYVRVVAYCPDGAAFRFFLLRLLDMVAGNMACRPRKFC